MKNFLVVAVVLLGVGPVLASAYETTDQAAVRVSDDTALYSISFNLGHGDHDIYVPINTKRGAETGNAIGYSLLAGGDSPTGFGYMTGVLMSNTPRDGQYYKVPAGTKADFTFYGLLRHNHITGDIEDDYALRITHLPFYFDADMKPNGLNDSELQYYTTPELDLDKVTGSSMTLKIVPKEQ